MDMTLKQFEEQYQNKNTDWKFNLFKIVCNKCGSTKVEYDGKLETENGYYGEFTVTNKNVIKCHDCGNAFTIEKSEGGSSSYWNHDD